MPADDPTAADVSAPDDPAVLLRRTLEGVRGAAGPDAAAPGRRRRRAKAQDGRTGRPGGYTGPGPDEGDPQRLSDAVADYVDERGWNKTVTAAGVLGRWAAIVGSDIAAHSRPESLVAGELVVVAESTAWATQLRLLSATLLARIADEIGAGVVRRVVVRGPTAPNWRHGPLRVRGRGARDTYG